MHKDHSSTLEDPNTCIIDSATTYSVLRDRYLFHKITPFAHTVTIIDSESQIEEDYGPTSLRLPYGIVIHIASTTYAP